MDCDDRRHRRHVIGVGIPGAGQCRQPKHCESDDENAHRTLFLCTSLQVSRSASGPNRTAALRSDVESPSSPNATLIRQQDFPLAWQLWMPRRHVRSNSKRNLWFAPPRKPLRVRDRRDQRVWRPARCTESWVVQLSQMRRASSRPSLLSLL